MQLLKILLSILAQNLEVLEVSIKEALSSHNSLWDKRDMPHKVRGAKQKQKTQAPEMLISQYRSSNQSCKCFPVSRHF